MRTRLHSDDGWRLPKGLEGRVICAADLIDEAMKPPDFVIDRIAEAGDVVLLTGVEKDSLKTWLAMTLVIARTIGGSWLGFNVKKGKPLRSLFISTETRKAPLTRRQISMLVGTNFDSKILARYLYIEDEPITLIPRVERERVYNKAQTSAEVAAMKVPNVPTEQGRKAELKTSAERIAKFAVDDLGQNLDLLDALAVPDTWGLIIIDTLRECLDGEENNSQDARRFMAAARELARECGCVVLIIHHSNKSGAHGEARSARGSGQLTASPDVLMTVDASGEYPTMHFKLRNHEPVDPVGYKLVVTGKATSIDVLPACAGKGAKDGAAESELLAVFEEHPNDGLSMTTLRREVARLQGKKEGSKAAASTIKTLVDALLARNVISECEIAGSGSSKPIPGYRLGSVGGKMPKKRINGRNTGESGDLGLLFGGSDA